MRSGPYLRIEEGAEQAVLCNNEAEAASEASGGPDFEIVSPRSRQTRKTEDGDNDFEASSRNQETQVVYSRDNVAIWPTRKQRIMGRVSLTKQDRVVFFTWLPYRPGSAEGEPKAECPEDMVDVASTPVSQGQYAVHPIPLSDLKAIRKHTPKLSTQYIVLILRNGLTLPPFCFHAGGVRALFSTLKQHCAVTKSAEDSTTFLINDVDDPLQRSIAIMELSDVLMMEPAQLASAHTQLKGQQDGEASDFIGRMVESYQRATQFAKDTTSSILKPPKPGLATILGDKGNSGKAAEKEETGVGLFELVDRSESDSMANGFHQPCLPPLTQDEWFTFFDSAGRVQDVRALKTRIFNAGTDPGIRKEVWKFLLGMFPPDSTDAYRQKLMAKRSHEYDCIKAQWTSITEKQAAKFGKWRERKTRVDKDVRRTDCKHAFFQGEDNPNVEILRNILLTYSMYNFDLGYCQGMSDLVSPILYVMRDEALAFWCFVSLMERMEPNFNTDCAGMHSQLEALKRLVQLTDPELHNFLEGKDCLNYFFCYRWLLVHFKREFTFEEILQLWEALWSCPLTPHFHIFMCMAVLRMHRRAIMSCGSFDEVLSFSIKLSGNLDLGRTMRCAAKIFRQAGASGTQCLTPVELAN